MPLALNIYNNELQTVVPDYSTVNLVLSSELDNSSSTAILSSQQYVQGNFLPLSGGILTGPLSAHQFLDVRGGCNISGNLLLNNSVSGNNRYASVSFQEGYARPGNLAYNLPGNFAIQSGDVLTRYGNNIAAGNGQITVSAQDGNIALQNSIIQAGRNNLSLNSSYAYGNNAIAAGLSYSGANYSIAFGDEGFASGNACFVAGRKTVAGTPFYFSRANGAGPGLFVITFNSPLPPLQPLIKVVTLKTVFGSDIIPPLEAIVDGAYVSNISPYQITVNVLRGSISSGGSGYIVLAGTTGLGNNAIAFGHSSSAFGEDSFCTGYFTQASGARSNAHGSFSKALGDQSFAYGNSTIAAGLNTVVEGISSQAIGDQSHAEGNGTKALGLNSHSEGYETLALGNESHAEGRGSRSLGLNSHASGYYTVASNESSFTYGYYTSALGNFSHASGLRSLANAQLSYACGEQAQALHFGSWVFNGLTSTIANTPFSSTREGQFTVNALGGIYLNETVGIKTDSVDNALTVNGTISSNDTFTGRSFTGDTFITNQNNINVQTGTTYTVQASDNGKTITFNSSSSISVNIPNGLPVGFNSSFIQLGTGQVSFFAIGTALMYSDGSKFKIASRYSMATLVSHATDEYVLAGNISL